MNAEWEDPRAALDRAAKVIEGADLVALACHVNPDGDALGSMLALHHTLLSDGRRSIASFPEPFVVAPHYRDLPGLDLLVPPSEFPSAPDVMITFDCGSMDRLGGLQPSAEAAKELIVLDHHVSNDRYGTINVIDQQAAATGVVVRDLIGSLGLPLTDRSAVAIYTALVCDTGRFQYESTTPEVFALAGELLQYDVPVERLSRTLFEEHRFAYIQLLGEALANAVLVPEKRFVWTFVTQKMLAHHDVNVEEVEGLIDIVRRTLEADVACVIKEERDGTLKVSLRSVGDTDVQRIATANGGGGHRFAAGFSSSSSIAETAEIILAAL